LFNLIPWNVDGKLKAATIGCHLNTATYVTTLIVINLVCRDSDILRISRRGIIQGHVIAKKWALGVHLGHAGLGLDTICQMSEYDTQYGLILDR
jgi:hypothetical protein